MKAYDSNNGPTMYTDLRANDAQRLFYKELQQYSFAASTLNNEGKVVSADYYLVLELDGIKYYTPNDERWGTIVAIDTAHELAVDTGFYETNDFEYPDSDYKIVVNWLNHSELGPVLNCAFEGS
jgi:hypothetical protein